MEESTDTFAWTHKLKCPPTLCNDSVKKILRRGLVGLLWDELADIIFTSDEAQIIRKNVLLHQLKEGTPNKVVQCMQNMIQLKSNKNDLKNEISKLEEEYEREEFLARQKVQELRDISFKRSQIKVKKDLLKMKYDQTVTQLRDCNDMRLVCQHLMPNTCKDLDPKIIMEMSNIVTSLWAGANKRQVWDTVSNNLDNIEVPTLWYHLYQNLAEDVDTLIKSENMVPLDTDKENVNVGIAKIYGQHIAMVSKRLLYHAKANGHQQNVLEFIDKIEAASNNSVDLSEWLALALEVRKLEIEQRNLQEELHKIQEELKENNIFIFELAQLTSEIQNIDTEIMEYVQDIQQSLKLLKSSPMHLIKMKEKISLELQRILEIRNDGYDSTWLNNDLTTELDIFQYTLDLNALRKIMLKGDIGVYRHTKSCFNEASLLTTKSQGSNIMCYFPMVQTPIYSLIDCYKNLILTFVYKKFESLKVEENPDVFQMPILTYDENNYDTVKLLSLSKVVNKKTKSEIYEFNEILNAWVHQTVQKVMEIIEKIVDDATFSEWTERYNFALYMLQNPFMH